MQRNLSIPTRSYGIAKPGASRILRESWQELQSRIAEIVALRERMADFQDQRYEPDYKKLWQQLVAQDERLTAGALKA